MLPIGGGEAVKVLSFESSISDYAFSPDGKRIGAPSSDGKARIWRLSDGTHIELSAHRDEVNTLRFSPDGKLVATASDDGTVRVWDALSGRPFWHAPVMLPSPPRLWSHRGWQALDGSSTAQPPPSAWRRAIEAGVQRAASSPGGRRLCTLGFDGALVLWDVERDRKVARSEALGAHDLLATSQGCVVRKNDSVLLVGSSGSRALDGADAPSAIGADNAQILVATGPNIVSYDQRSAERGDSYPATVGVTAVAVAGAQLVAGYRDGNIELISTKDTRGQRSSTVDFESAPAASPRSIIAGPDGTLVVGYANGLLGLWDQHNGKRLASAQLHGQISHLAIDKHKLYAATDLGHHLVWDLSPFYQDRCALLREVWARTPIVWESGRTTVRLPAADHHCNK